MRFKTHSLEEEIRIVFELEFEFGPAQFTRAHFLPPCQLNCLPAGIVKVNGGVD